MCLTEKICMCMCVSYVEGDMYVSYVEGGTVLTRYYAPFVYKPPLPFCANSLRRYIYLQFKPPLTTEELYDSDERQEG